MARLVRGCCGRRYDWSMREGTIGRVAVRKSTVSPKCLLKWMILIRISGEAGGYGSELGVMSHCGNL